MQITIFSFLSALLWSSLLIVAIYLLRHTRFKQHFGVLSMVLLYLFCAVRLFLPLEFPHTLIAADGVIYPYIYNLLTRERTMLGAGRLRTVFHIVLPAAGPGILSGVILGIGRIVGETAALIFTAGTMAQIPGLFQSGRTLAIHMYVLSGEALHMNEANATAVVLLLVVLLMNMLSALAAKKLTKK